METKPAHLTTEFWLTIIAQVIFFLNTTQAWTFMPQKWSALVQAIILAAYSISRGWAKSNIAPDAAVPANKKLSMLVSKKDYAARH